MLYIVMNFMFFVLFMVLLSIWKLKEIITFNLKIFNYLLNINKSMTLDKMSMSCIFMLIMCFIISTVFYWHYFSWHSDYLIFKMQLFVLSMFMLLLTSSVVFSFMSWEFLGITSFFLIIYYSMYCSSRAALITMISSRLGDIGFFIFMSCFICKLENYIELMCGIFMLLLLISKSAIFPLSSWLLEAMRAPTPVSSLVHSSTLVAAGVFLMCRYESMLMNNKYSYFLLIMCMFTMILSAISAFFYKDTKKIMALSTCKNISWCYIYMYSGMLELGLIQLICHGMFKCMLFCFIGDFLVKSTKSQNKSMHFYMSSWSYSLMINMMCLFVSGLPFLGVYFSKHLFLNYLSDNLKFLLLIFCILGLSLSFLYTFRLLNILKLDYKSSSSGFKKMFYLPILMVPYLLMLKSYMCKLFMEDFFSKFKIMFMIKMLIMIMTLMGYYFIFSSCSNWNKSLLGMDFFIIDSIMIFSMLEKFIYKISMFRWEAFFINILSIFRFKKELSLIFFLLMSLMFYLFILV